ncbi:MAG: integrase core domain-containing protein, partial [Pseudomonadota bacterium]
MGSSASSLLRITRQAPPPRVAAEAISALPEARPPEVSASVPAIPTEIAPRPDALEALYSLLLSQGSPEYIRSDNGPEFAAKAMQGWLRRVGITPICIYPGSLLSGHRHAMPCRGSAWENGYNERFNGTLRREVLNAEWFTTT